MTTPEIPRTGVACAMVESCAPATDHLHAFPRWKRALDITFVLLALPIVLPIGSLIAAFIKIVSPGPAFFRQKRIGLNGHPFMCLKFRTMKVNADTGVHQAHLKALMTANQPTRKLDGVDKRLISGGVFLRALGVDELPQLFNVFFGDMSLVGPRPCTPFEYELYSARHRRRCEAPPGLTGLWQVSGKNHTTFEQMIDYDLYYAEHKSVWFDLKIIFLTVPAILALVWEMKLSPAARARRRHQKAELAAVSNTNLNTSGTADARE